MRIIEVILTRHAAAQRSYVFRILQLLLLLVTREEAL